MAKKVERKEKEVEEAFKGMKLFFGS